MEYALVTADKKRTPLMVEPGRPRAFRTKEAATKMAASVRYRRPKLVPIPLWQVTTPLLPLRK